jgi:phospholipase C
VAASETITSAGGGEPPIRHVVVILQENHSFDNVLGQLCIQDHRECNAASSGKNLEGRTIPLSRASDVVPLVGHQQKNQLTAMDNGKMDGWERVGGCTEDECYTQYDPKQIPSLAALARAGAISDSFYSRNIVPSWGGHLDLFAQTLDGFVGDNPTFVKKRLKKGFGWGCDSNNDALWTDPVSHNLINVPSCIPDQKGNGPYRPSPVQYTPTFGDRLDAAGRSWGIYGATDPKVPHDLKPYIWSICPSFAECLNGPQHKNMHEESQFFSDASRGTLPSFSILTPAGVSGSTSQHNDTSMLVGDNQIGSEVSAIQKGPDGKSTTIFIYYDDCGCFYDHATPPSGLGIRLPLVIVSPYAKPGFTDHNVATNSSILAYTESVYGVKPVNSLDATAYDFHQSFDYSSAAGQSFAFEPAAVPQASRDLHPAPDGT